jgi:hypothetical protein
VGAHATLAWVKYPPNLQQESAWSLLLLIKPGLTDDLPADLLNYQCTEPDFPHQTTLDQFFDEAQWESYRRLGESLAALLFANHPTGQGGDWTPRQMHR